MVWCFFCKQKTAYEMRIRDWSSDVCSSDLDRGSVAQRRGADRPESRARPEPGVDPRRFGGPDRARPAGGQGTGRRLSRRIGRLAVAVHPRPRPVRFEPCRDAARSEEHTSELQSLMRISYAVFCLTKKNTILPSSLLRQEMLQHIT